MRSFILKKFLRTLGIAGFADAPLKHWLIQRSTAILIVFTLLLAPFWFLLFALNILIFCHFYLGIEEILADYIHNETCSQVFLKLFLISVLISIKNVLVFFML
jgi:succinate dehydrogenase hydrophobic anchor subunit